MSEAQAQSHSSWRQLEHEWSQAQEHWRDSTTQYFARHFWEPLEGETEAYQRALESLIETLQAAQQVARAG
ncbi:MAG: hypothetical protein ONB06_07265 [candidate division KSB1 bacterium]|nr:hypothetical protein [candidate division KSB1 bacterium]